MRTSPIESVSHFLPLIDDLESREDVFTVQFELVEWLNRCERSISRIRDKPEEFNQETIQFASSVDSVVLPRGEFSDSLECSRANLLGIGDSIAWLLLNREFIRGSSIIRKGGYVTFRGGFEAELAALKFVFHERSEDFAILNDLTRCLGIGDLTILGRRGIDIVEVKSSPFDPQELNDRTERQIRRMSWLSDYLSADRGILPLDFDSDHDKDEGDAQTEDARWTRIVGDFEEMYYHGVLSSLLDEAVENSSGHASTSVDDVGVLCAMKSDKNIEDTDLFELTRDIAWQGGRDLLLGCVSRSIYEYPDILPIHIFDLTFESRLNLLTEEVIAFIVYPIENLLGRLRQRGLHGRFDPHTHSFQFIENEVMFAVMEYPLRRLVYELLSVETFGDLIRASIDQHSGPEE